MRYVIRSKFPVGRHEIECSLEFDTPPTAVDWRNMTSALRDLTSCDYCGEPFVTRATCPQCRPVT